MAPPDPRQIHITSRLGASVPPHVNMPHVLSNAVYPGYSFLQQESMEAVARRQELVQKQNLARSSLDDLHGNTRLMTTGPYPPVSSWQKEKGRRLGRRVGNHKASGCNARSSKNQEEDRNPDQILTVSAAEKEDKKDLDTEPHPKYEPSQSNGEPATVPTKSLKEHEHSPQKSCEERGIGDLFLNGEDLSSVEDIRKWAIDDVYDFITGLPGCSDYAQIFRDHAIDGETLPLLTEEHLLDTMGLKLGPALKIRSQV
ncbi:sterile alpha motif domain-containing protein 7 [Phascolarctos cinereus]